MRVCVSVCVCVCESVCECECVCVCVTDFLCCMSRKCILESCPTLTSSLLLLWAKHRSVAEPAPHQRWTNIHM